MTLHLMILPHNCLLLLHCSDYFVLPSLTDEGHRVSVLRLKDKNIDRFSLQTVTRRVLMVMDTRLVEEACLSNIMILDLKVTNTFIYICAFINNLTITLGYYMYIIAIISNDFHKGMERSTLCEN